MKYKIIKSWRKFKKLAVLYNGKYIHFGDTRYSDYLEHRDKKRRERYLKRASQIRDRYGNLTINNPNSPNYWATRILWKYKG